MWPNHRLYALSLRSCGQSSLSRLPFQPEMNSWFFLLKRNTALAHLLSSKVCVDETHQCNRCTLPRSWDHRLRSQARKLTGSWDHGLMGLCGRGGAPNGAAKRRCQTALQTAPSGAANGAKRRCKMGHGASRAVMQTRTQDLHSCKLAS